MVVLRRHRVMFTVSALALVALSLVASPLPTRAAGAIAPRVSNFQAVPATLPQQGGSVTLTGALASSATCLLTAAPLIANLVAAPACTSASLDQQVDVPPNLTAVPVTYTFNLKAKNAAGKASGSTSVTVAPLVVPTISDLAASKPEFTPAGGAELLTAHLTGAPSCSIKVSPKIKGFNANPTCSGGLLSQQIAVPANTSTTPVVYIFHVKAKNSVGVATAAVSVTVDALTAPSVGTMTVTPSSVSGAGGVVHLQGPVTGDPTCTVKVTPAVTGSPFKPSCTGGTMDLPITLPANSGLSTVVYTFKISATNSVGKAKGSASASVLAGSLPSVTSFTPTTGALTAAGGPITLSGSLSGASTCSISVTPSISGGPWAPSCSGGTLSQPITIPSNPSTTKAATFTFKLTATNATGSVNSSTQVVVAPLVPSTVTSFTASPGPSDILGGPVTLSGTVTVATSCSITVSPGIIGAPYNPSCASGSLSQQVQLPINLGAQPVTYTFSLTATGLAGTSHASTVAVVVPAAFPALSYIVPQALITAHGYPSAISCPTATFCAAVDLSGAALVRTSGTWSAPLTVDSSQLTAISCTSSAFCQAVDASGGVIAYNGTTWSAPSAVSTQDLTSISCASPTSCLAGAVDGSIFSWNGTSWSVGQSVSPYSLRAVSCPSPSFCMVVDSAGEAFSFNGTTWSAAATVSQDALSAVSCATTTSCVATGVMTGGSNVFQWNGTTWSSAADLGGLNEVIDVSCPSASTCSAVDDHGNAYVASSGVWSASQTLEAGGLMTAESCDSGTHCVAMSFAGFSYTWTGPSPSSWTPDGRVDVPAGALTSISCGSPTSCVTVSSDGTAFVRSAGGWSAPGMTGLSNPTGVSCTASTFCMAVSLDGTAAIFDGTSWTSTGAVPTTPPLDAVSCTSPTYCLAVSAGGDFVTFNGATWSSPITTPSQTAAINGVSCVTSTFCAAVSQNGTVWFWNGTGLSASKVVFTLSVPGQSIACTKITYCVVGSRDGRVATWTGGAAWTTASVSTHSIPSVACIRGSSACMALDSIGQVSTSVGPATWTAPVIADTNGAAVASACTSSGSCVIIDDDSTTRSS